MACPVSKLRSARMARSLNYSALASSVSTLELREQVQREGGSVREAHVSSASFFERHRRQARLASALVFASALAAIAVMGAGAAGGAWRRSVEARGALRGNGTRVFAQAFSTVGIGHCETPEDGSQCARDIEYAMAHIKKHPDWYVGLHAEDNPKAFQWFLHKQRTAGGKRRCPPPCHWNVETSDESTKLYGDCHTSEKGESCYNHVQYTIKENLPKHPEWYPGLSEGSSFKIVQQYLHHQGVCPTPCGLKEELAKQKKAEKKKEEYVDGMPCHTAEAGEACYGDILFAKKKLAEGTHNEWYEGKLSATSSLQEIQAYLHGQHSSDKTRLCPLPCSKSAVKNISKYGDGPCHTATEGDKCWKAAKWVVEVGVKKKPQWYKGDNISLASTFEHVQNRLAQEKDPDRACKSAACPCASAKKGDECWGAIQWVMDVGLKKHKKWYKDLPEEPTYEQVQVHLHGEAHTKCGMPCVFAPWWDKPEAKETDPLVA